MSQFRHVVARHVPLWVRMGGRKIVYRGSSRTCEFCGSSVRTFLTNGSDIPVLRTRKVIGGVPRPEDRCPVCHSQDRTRLMRFYLEREMGVSPGQKKRLRILHIAPDLGLVLWIKKFREIYYVGTDIDRARYRHVPNFVEADLTRLPFGDGEFDIVICSHVLEHVPDDRVAIREMKRVLAPGGVALVLVPFATDGGETDEDPRVSDPQERERRFGQWDHVRLYTREDLVSRLGEAGFEVELFDAYREDPIEAERRMINPLELLPVAMRRKEARPANDDKRTTRNMENGYDRVAPLANGAGPGA